MKLYRFLAGILVLSLLFSVLPAASAATDTNGVAQAIIESCTYGIEIDLTEYHMPVSRLERLFFQLLDTGKLPWYTDKTYTYHYDESTNMVQSFTPVLLDEDTYNRKQYEARIAEILDQYVFEGMDKVQIALSLHDALIVNSIYDDALVKRTGYDLLVNGITVCAGYAAAYQDLLNRVGIPCITVHSEAMNHAWNLVCIDDQWYHVDVTWDDPTPDSYGFVSHQFFLRTDEEMAAGEEPHYDWETDITCTDTRFSGAFWRDVTSQICFTDSSNAYFVRSVDWTNYIHHRDMPSAQETRIYTDKKEHINIGYGSYSYSHGGLSLWNGRLYYNTQDAVKSMQPDGSDVQDEFRYDTRGNGKHLYTCHADKDTLYITAKDHNNERTAFTQQLENSGYHAHSYTTTTQAPTCTKTGYDVSVCECGLSFQSDPTAKIPHSYEEVDGKKASIFSDGYSTQQCTDCADEIHNYYPKISILNWILEHRTLTLIGIVLISVLLSSFSKGKKQKTKS